MSLLGRKVTIKNAVRVIVVEDDPNMREFVSDALKGLGFELSAFASVRDALKFMSSTPSVDLIISDLEMPDLTGRDFFNLLSEQFPGAIPFIMMTGKTGVTREACLKIGMADFLAKPFSVRDLARVVAPWLEERTRRLRSSVSKV